MVLESGERAARRGASCVFSFFYCGQRVVFDPYGNKFEITDPDIRMQLGEPFQGTFHSVVGVAFSVQFLQQEFGYTVGLSPDGNSLVTRP